MDLKPNSKISVVLLVSLLMVTFSATAVLAQKNSKKQTVVTVNDLKINKTQLNKQVSSVFGYRTMMKLYKNQMTQILGYLQTKGSQSLMKLYLLNKLMVEKLKNKKIDELGLSVADKELKSKVDEIIKNNKKIKDRSKLKELLKKQKMTLDQYKNKILKKRILQNKLRDKVTGSIEVTKKEKKSYYEKNKKSFKDKKGNVKKLKEVSNKIEGIISDKKKREKYKKWLQKTKAEAKVDFSKSFLKSINKQLPGVKVKELSFLSWTGK